MVRLTACFSVLMASWTAPLSSRQQTDRFRLSKDSVAVIPVRDLIATVHLENAKASDQSRWEPMAIRARR